MQQLLLAGEQQDPALEPWNEGINQRRDLFKPAWGNIFEHFCISYVKHTIVVSPEDIPVLGLCRHSQFHDEIQALQSVSDFAVSNLPWFVLIEICLLCLNNILYGHVQAEAPNLKWHYIKV